MTTGPTFGVPRYVVEAIQIDHGLMPGDIFYNYMSHASGPAPAESFNMNSVASLVAPSIYEVSLGTEWLLNRFAIGIFSTKPNSEKFGGIAELTNGCLLQVVDENDEVLVDFTAGVPITKNSDFNYMTGIDTVLDIGTGIDFVRVRFTVAEAGQDMLIGKDQRVRMVIQDDLTGIVDMRCMCQGIRLI